MGCMLCIACESYALCNDHSTCFTVFISIFSKLAYTPRGILDLDFRYDLIDSLTRFHWHFKIHEL